MSKHHTHGFFKDLVTDTVMLTPNRRLSAALHKFYQQFQLEQQHESWLTPQILPVTSWIHHLWNELTSNTFTPSPLLLNTSQEQLLWEKILLSTKENEQLIQLSETADLARSAWSLLLQWQVDLNHPLFNSSDDYTALHHWVREFQRLCAENHWIDMATLPNVIMENIKSRVIVPPQAIMTYGFTEYSPQLNQLLKICEAAGSKVTHLQSLSESDDCKRISLLDNEHEIQTIARWAKSIHERHPTASIGCVIPSLDKIRDRVVQVFSEVFAAEDTYTVDTQNCPFNISAGKSLSQYPIINTALQILSLHKKNISAEILSHILSTPFIGEAEIERVKRAHYDSQLRVNNKSNINLITISNPDNDHKNLSLTKTCPQLAKRLRKYIAVVDENQQNQTHAEWAAQFSRMLTTLGWPGERSLSSEEYQIIESWLNLLNEFAILDQVSQPVNLYQALHMLQKMAGHMIFQPKSPEATIQVLGILEAAAMPFDHLWVAGMDDVTWPPQPRPNPFIPKRLQRDLRMPHATAERELTFCNIITRQFKQCAPQVIFSHADKSEELELQPSPLIRNLSRLTLQDLRFEEYISPVNKIFHSRQIEWIVDDKAPDVSAEEKIRGGVSVIRQQALCPFKSFSEWRLHAHELESPLPGLRAKDRGTVIHKSLELVWNQIKNHSTLISLDESALDTIIHASITEALKLTPNSHSEFKQYISLEKQRLHHLISEWLRLEKERPPFKISTNEKTIQFTLGQLPLTIRIDRIDELEDGKKLIIDYKTGKNNEISSWFSERPEEPQLPLYSLLDSTNTSGITFAQIHPGEHCFKGVSHYAMDVKGIKLISEIKKTTALSWGEQIEQWLKTLTQLSDDFYYGNARVDPKDPPQTCTWCALKPLCRINEEITSS